ncbi:MAG: hypothetical protein VYC34_00765, partial [Planctomycetota bacterium]|nr:hypothetical protein [Planctomycetota bacterium]
RAWVVAQFEQKEDGSVLAAEAPEAADRRTYSQRALKVEENSGQVARDVEAEAPVQENRLSADRRAAAPAPPRVIEAAPERRIAATPEVKRSIERAPAGWTGSRMTPEAPRIAERRSTVDERRASTMTTRGNERNARAERPTTFAQTHRNRTQTAAQGIRSIPFVTPVPNRGGDVVRSLLLAGGASDEAAEEAAPAVAVSPLFNRRMFDETLEAVAPHLSLAEESDLLAAEEREGGPGALARAWDSFVNAESTQAWSTALVTIRNDVAALPPAPRAFWLGGSAVLVLGLLAHWIGGRRVLGRAAKASPECEALIAEAAAALQL